MVLLSLIVALAAAAVVCAASVYFANGLEWLGRRLQLSEVFTGSVLAALGTALPETLITLFAVARRTPASQDIGIGAALSGPFLLSTLGYGVAGLAALALRQAKGPRAAEAGEGAIISDQIWFLLALAPVLGLGALDFPRKRASAIGLLGLYALYVGSKLRASGGQDPGSKPSPLKLAPQSATPSLAPILLQTTIALGLVVGASYLFVNRLGDLSHRLHVPATLAGLLIAPLATELPEVVNTLVWIRQDKVRLALSNLSGAMVIQMTIPTALGILFTPWRLDPSLLIAGLVMGVAVAACALVLWRRLALRWLAAGVPAYGVTVAILVMRELGAAHQG